MKVLFFWAFLDVVAWDGYYDYWWTSSIESSIEPSSSYYSGITFLGSCLIPSPIISSLSITPPMSHLITNPISSAEYKALSSSSNARALIGKCGGLSYWLKSASLSSYTWQSN